MSQGLKAFHFILYIKGNIHNVNEFLLFIMHTYIIQKMYRNSEYYTIW